jgi:hypothetical protein
MRKSLCFNTTIMPQPTEITQFIFDQPLSASPFPRNGCRGKLDWVNLFTNVGVQYLADGIARAQLPLRGLARIYGQLNDARFGVAMSPVARRVRRRSDFGSVWPRFVML